MVQFGLTMVRRRELHDTRHHDYALFVFFVYLSPSSLLSVFALNKPIPLWSRACSFNDSHRGGRKGGVWFIVCVESIFGKGMEGSFYWIWGEGYASIFKGDGE